MDLSTFNTCVQGFLARMALHSAYERGDTTRIKRFFKTVEVGSLIGGLFMAVILVGLAISMFLTAYDSSQEAARNVPVIPAAAGAAPPQTQLATTLLTKNLKMLLLLLLLLLPSADLLQLYQQQLLPLNSGAAAHANSSSSSSSSSSISTIGSILNAST